MSKNPKVEYYQDKAGKWRWRLKGANGEIVSHGDDYDSHTAAMTGFVTQARIAIEVVFGKDRADAFNAVNGERNYQNTLPRNEVKNQRPMEQVAIIRHILQDMERAWYEEPGQPSMDYARKVAAVAVRMMEEHGVVHRGG